MEPNDHGVTAVMLDFDPASAAFRMRDERGEHMIRNGLAGWAECTTSMTGNDLHHQYQPEEMRGLRRRALG